ncbi:hypothetical protein FWC63_00920 [Candidatus Saccharibacteria bacterium]|nr:hypothetical protein [Candidatus Saccharibacteria bacterium]
MSKLIFATSNARKVAEASLVAERHGVILESRALEVEEIQDRDPLEVSRTKVKAAFVAAGAPVVVNDSSWSIPALNGFPGAYMRDVTRWFVADDWLKLMAKRGDRTIVLTESTLFFDGETTKIFQRQQKGRFLEEARGKKNVSIEEVVSLVEDGRTMAEITEVGEDRGSATMDTWEEFFTWYKDEYIDGER